MCSILKVSVLKLPVLDVSNPLDKKISRSWVPLIVHMVNLSIRLVLLESCCCECCLVVPCCIYSMTI